MANRATQSLGTGMKILSGANIPTYTLEYLTSTEKKNQGSFETIVVPYVELGRDKKCGVTFGDDTPTVSRKHAAIERKGNETFIINLSKSNPTLVNGRPVENKYFLNNGDEIQLSVEGPRLRYNTTKAGTAKIGFTNKMNLVMQQAVKPYKTAAVSFLMMLLAITSVGGYYIYDVMTLTEEQQIQLSEQRRQIAAQEQMIVEQTEVMEEQSAAYLRELAELQSNNVDLNTLISELQGELEDVRISAASGSTAASEFYQAMKDDVYFLHSYVITRTTPSGTRYRNELGMTCSGFLLDDGTFVTARHCVQFWRYPYPPDRTSTILNTEELEGTSIDIEFTATSPRDEIRLKLSDFQYDESRDRVTEIESNRLRIAQLDYTDWAYAQTGRNNGAMEYDRDLSSNLSAGSTIYILGYSYGMGGSSESSNVAPLLSQSSIAQDGLSNRGYITLTGRGFGQGNSGGPAFVLTENGIRAVGIVSAGTGAEIGSIVPLSAMEM
jgi:hypothetical protein